MNEELSSFDSKEELYFYWYLKELVRYGYVEKYVYQPKSFVLIEPVNSIQIIPGKLKRKIKSTMLLREHTYKADFLIYWNNKAEKVFYAMIDEIIAGAPFRHDHYPFIANMRKNASNVNNAYSVVDVKGNYSQNDAYRRFSTDQKLVMDKMNIYVQKIVPAPSIDKNGKIKVANALFLKTFVPERYLLTDKNKEIRKIRFPVRSINEYVNNRKDENRYL